MQMQNILSIQTKQTTMKKILFNDRFRLTQAVISGVKTQTRRIISEKLLNEYGHNKYNDKSYELIANAPYKVGDVLAVAQNYYEVWDFIKATQDALTKATIHLTNGWGNKMFVKSALMPNLIEITKVRVERLQDISEGDCLAEGIAKEQVRIEYDEPIDTVLYSFENSKSLKKYTSKYSLCGYYNTPKEAFSDLINAISGRNTWERNPYVFAYEFKLVFKLTDAEKEEIRQYDGSYHNDDDFSYIESIAQKMDFYTDNADFYKVNSKRITPLQAISLLGREEFWSGVLRAAYHGTAVRGNILIKNYNYYGIH